jgi:hypothetical protein
LIKMQCVPCGQPKAPCCDNDTKCDNDAKCNNDGVCSESQRYKILIYSAIALVFLLLYFIL